ncbi:FAD-binding oxidoreductase [Mesobaculum littorinae]|uniref:FAD-binding oxidoreductase n=1 Tax=Mesobaculum littorinae TaxID=2486419 RepID=A0A438AFB4_9RHOB|nr:FAD-binding oxidoreductase [Mesobaculum littorinae]RVV97413.1 FAD-binding oxidoreductase [Mesobaculum littorinae]
MAAADVTVMGAGIFGLSVAYACLKRGARVRVVDPGGPGAGASGGIVGALSPHVPENWNPKKAFQLESLLLAREFWPEVEALSGRPTGYAPHGRIQPLADTRAVELAQSRATSAAALWRGEAVWAVIDAEAAAAGLPPGWLPEAGSGAYVRDTLSAHIHPAQAVAALAGAIRSRGGEITTAAVPEAAVSEAALPEAAAPEGAVIWATGAAGLEDLSRAFGRALGVAVKGQAALLGTGAALAPQIFAGGLHIVPHLDGTTAIGSTSEREFAGTDTDAQLDDVIDRARSVIPALREAPVIARWAGLRPRAYSRAPLLGEWPGRPGHFVANGGFKIGFGVAPMVGQVMADLVLDGRDAIPEGFGFPPDL